MVLFGNNQYDDYANIAWLIPSSLQLDINKATNKICISRI